MDLEWYKNEVEKTEKVFRKKRIYISVIFALLSLGGFFLIIFIFEKFGIIINEFWFVVLFFGVFYGGVMGSLGGEFSWILKYNKEYRELREKLKNYKDEIKKIEERMAQERKEKRRKECFGRLAILDNIYSDIFNKKISQDNIGLCQKFIEIVSGEWSSDWNLYIYSLDPDFDREKIGKIKALRQYSRGLQDRITNFFKQNRNRRIENKVQNGDKKEMCDGMSQEGNVRLVDSDTLAPPPALVVEFKDIDKLPKKRIKIDFLEKNRKNMELGLRGELIVLDWEKGALIKDGLENLVGKVRHISQEFGDGFGFDILSFNKDGSDKFIEVKTTEKGINSQFYFSENELNFIKNNEDYYLYRLNLQNEEEAELIIINKEDFINKFEIFPYQYIVKLKEQ